MLSDCELFNRIFDVEVDRDLLEEKMEKLQRQFEHKLGKLQDEYARNDIRLQNLYMIEDQRGGKNALEKRLATSGEDAGCK
jgi:dynactin complex subunit